MSFDIPSDTPLGNVLRAPENFVSRSDIALVNRVNETDRRSFFKKAFAAAAVGGILVLYAILGALVWPKRNKTPQALAVFAAAFTGPDFIEGTTAFTQKRKPEFGQ